MAGRLLETILPSFETIFLETRCGTFETILGIFETIFLKLDCYFLKLYSGFLGRSSRY